jgi:hypothetical protein
MFKLQIFQEYKKKIEIIFLDSETYKVNKEVLLRHVLGLHPVVSIYKPM